jgi:diguanylate cyclase (GGDEF)-like protein
MVPLEPQTRESLPPERLVVEVFSEISQETIQKRWQAVNTILRLSVLAGLQMQLDATLNMLADFAAEIVAFEGASIYFWDENQDKVQLRVERGLEHVPTETVGSGNILNLWATKFSRPLLVTRGQNEQADALLSTLRARSAMVVPLFVSNRVMGSLQLFSQRTSAFNHEDAQLLWMLSLVAETLITRDFVNDGLIRFAFTDYLTGLKTRGYFEQQLELEIKRSERRKTHFAVMMIDIDYFKRLNDHYGHHVGDQVLRDLASILMKDMREVDTVARYGGEEFVIVLPETGGPGARLVAERLRRAVEKARFFAGSPTTVKRLTISIGIAIFETDARFKSDVIEFADAALYAAKAGGRNRIVMYSEMAAQERKEVS